MRSTRCEPSCPPAGRLVFCPHCGGAYQDNLKRVRLMGGVGVLNSSSPKVEAFLNTGDPAHLS